jgi:DNA-binding NarL/FixJ family response regulator
VISLLVADDQELVRMGLRVLVEGEDDVVLVGEAGDGQRAVELTRAHRPDVVLMDIRMPVRDGIGALREIVADPALGGTRVVMLTTFELDDYIFDCLAAGAAGFLLKDSEAGELLHAVRVVAAGGSLLSPSVTRRVIAEFADGRRRRKAHPRMGTLTEREAEVVGLVGEGLSNVEIAERLFLSPATVRTHVGRAMTKLDARDRAQLVVFAVQSGLTA